MAKVKKARVLDAAESTASYEHPEARALIRPEVGVQQLFKKRKPPATYLSANMDIQTGDLLKNIHSSQIFSVTGLPDIKVHAKGKKGEKQYQVEVLDLDTLDPISMEHIGLKGDDLPAWFLDTNYNGMRFHVYQALFPRTSAQDNLSAPSPAGTEGQIAVKVIDDPGNELIP